MKGTMTTKVSQSKTRGLDCCHRCGEFMVSEFSADTGMVEGHCVTCGERVDQVILSHRERRKTRQVAEQALAGSDHSRLN